jgi:1-acyl-sn-glycerol-3-phosphate acyltransferase
MFNKVIRIIHSIIWWIDWGLLVMVGIILDTVVWPGNREKYRAAERFWAWSLMVLGGIKLDISGQENLPVNETVVYMANHQSDLDWPIIFRSIPGFYLFVAKKELFQAPVFGTYMKIQGYIPIDRSRVTSSVKTYQDVVTKIEQGESIVIYPEGTRSYTEKVQQFKPFSFAFLRDARVRVVPVAIDGSINIQKKGSRLIHPGRVRVRIMPPVSFEDLYDMELKDFCSASAERVREALISALKTDDDAKRSRCR